MRFTKLLTLLAATSAFAYNLKRDEFEDEAQKLGQVFDGVNTDEIENAANDYASKIEDAAANAAPVDASNNAPIDTTGMGGDLASEACVNLTTEIIKCLGNASEKKSNDEACNQFNSDECKTFLKGDFSACSGFEIYGITLASLKLSCGKDESGNYCPISKVQQSGGEKELTDKDIEETCKSKSCTDDAVEGFKQFKQFTEKINGAVGSNQDISVYDNYIKSLSEEKCVAAQSGATQIKVGSALLATLALALYLF